MSSTESPETAGAARPRTLHHAHIAQTPETEEPTVEQNDRLRLARMNLARVVEASDLAGLVLLDALGPETMWRTVNELHTPTPTLRRIFAAAHREHCPDARVPDLDMRFAAWRSRVDGPDDATQLRQLEVLEAWVAIPEDQDWPDGLDHLGVRRPIAVWGRGDRSRLPAVERGVAVVGSRNASAYGCAVTREIVHELAGHHWCVVSGGAFGIDAVAHTAALTVGRHLPVTVAVLACGVDRAYPRAHGELLIRIREHGLVLSEVPPGSAPTRYRFLQRNRLIAALTRATVVTEAAWRSGSLNTAHHAEGLSRIVAAVPGDVTTGGSSGCHRLIREDHAVLVGNGAEILELLGPLGNGATTEVRRRADHAARREEDAVPAELRRLYDSLPVRSDADATQVCRASGLGVAEVLGGLSRLRELGFATESLLGWRRTTHRPR